MGHDRVSTRGEGLDRRRRDGHEAKRIDALFEIERAINGHPPEARLTMRRRLSVPPPMTAAPLRNMEATRDSGHREPPEAGAHDNKNLGEQ